MGVIIIVGIFTSGCTSQNGTSPNETSLNLPTLWTYQIQGSKTPYFSVQDGVVYVGYEPGVDAINASNGMKKRDFKTGKPVTADPVMSIGVLYLTCQDSNVYALKPESGEKLWNFSAGDIISSSPVI